MSTKIYNKLVRDRIPEIISARGAVCETEILSEADYLTHLEIKLGEELADLLEVIYACAAARGYSTAELEALRKDKADKRGGFEKRILLKSVTEED